MKQITKLSEIVDIELNTGDRLGLFNESCSEENNTVNFKYKDGWELNRSMWDYRWETDNSNVCKSLKWLGMAQKLRKKIKSIKNNNRFNEKQEHHLECNGNLLNTISKYENDGFNTYYKIQRHSTSMGHYSHSTFDIYITRRETNIEFEDRSNAQLKYINDILKSRFKEKQDKDIMEASQELAQYKMLQEKFGVKE